MFQQLFGSRGFRERLQGLPVTMDDKEKLLRRLSSFWTLGLIVLWYFCNIGVLLLNKLLLSSFGFKYPIFLTMCHMIACSIFSYIAVTWLRIVPMQVGGPLHISEVVSWSMRQRIRLDETHHHNGHCTPCLRALVLPLIVLNNRAPDIMDFCTCFVSIALAGDPLGWAALQGGGP